MSVVLADLKLAPAVREFPVDVTGIFKDLQQKRSHENPTIGVLLCRSKDNEVVELALNSTLTPTLVSEYETKMIPKALLKKKLHEWSEPLEDRLATPQEETE